MPLLVTPGQLQRRAELYHQLSQLLAAGIGLMQALETLRRSPPDRSFREPLARMHDQLTRGSTFGDALAGVGVWTPSFDVALLRAGEQSGRLPACFKLLADYYNERAQLARQVLQDMAYPLFLFHFAIFLGPFPALITSGNVPAYAGQTLGILVPLHAAVFLLLYAAQGKHGESWRSHIESCTRRLPILGTARRSLALSRLAAALEALINAGVSIIDAWELAASASGSPALRRAVLAWKPRVLAGATPAQVVNGCTEFPELFANLYHTGEISGKLDETLDRLSALYREEGSRKLRQFAAWTPKLVYFAVVIMIAWRVVSFYAGLYGPHSLLNDVMK
ncbi:MAG TPA: type II secretion system F family protein [Verrucomicrobiae bacterium]|jgi:type II secretory pathway component PulF